MQETTMTPKQEGDLRRINKEAVRRFGLQMTENLNNNIHKGHWKGENNGYLLSRLREEIQELEDALRSGTDPKTIQQEAADIANFAMMIADNAVRAEEFERQLLEWLKLMEEDEDTCIGFVRDLEVGPMQTGITFRSEMCKRRAYQLAREYGLHLIVEDEAYPTGRESEGGEMRIKITRGKLWYKDKVGEEMEVIRTITDGYVVWQSEHEPADYDFVDPEDCVIIA